MLSLLRPSPFYNASGDHVGCGADDAPADHDAGSDDDAGADDDAAVLETELFRNLPWLLLMSNVKHSSIALQSGKRPYMTLDGVSNTIY